MDALLFADLFAHLRRTSIHSFLAPQIAIKTFAANANLPLSALLFSFHDAFKMLLISPTLLLFWSHNQ
jgi:hypothetical protein